ncbi:MAG: hypothetical protein AAFX93_08060 [Verrucomicrobiota bacterium]
MNLTIKRFLSISLSCLGPLSASALDPTPAELQEYNGAAFGAFPVEYPTTPSGQSNAIKLFGEYTLGDIDGELAYIESQGVNKVKTYAHAVWSSISDYNSGLMQFIDGHNTINEGPTTSAATTALATLNNPFDNWSSITGGTKWIIPMAAARGIDVFATANVTSGTISTSPSNMPATVDIKYLSGGQTKTVTVTTTGYSDAHWDIELALASIANDRLQFAQPTSSSGSYSITTLSGSNRDYVKALIVGNEVLSTGGLTVSQVKDMVKFAKSRRSAYGLDSLPITTSTNSLGNWQAMQTEVLHLIDTYIFFNTYGLPFTNVSGTNQASPTGLSTTNPAKSVGDNVISNIQAFKTWLAGTMQNSLIVVVGEHGYPSATKASDPNSIFDNKNAGYYYCGSSLPDYEGILSAIAKEQVLSFFFEPFDEPWKDLSNPTDGTENFWGIATAGQSERRVPSNQFDPSTYSVWEYPQTYQTKTDYCMPMIPAQTFDSDMDELTDNFEATIINHLSDDAITNFDHVSPTDDFDNDGLSEIEEQRLGTSPVSSDTDGDLFDDEVEVIFGSDPLDAGSLPVDVDVMTAVEFRFSTMVGFRYQVQYSEDLQVWEDLGDPILGDGNTQSILISFEGRSKDRELYRVSITAVD